ncbi:hypothetical protein BDY24DRAFT_379217 [Mrakia frigida]|uniref:quinone oxidoreductase family protein n=1 Tax=Mrakia frigida TaxID=29902 RepID=UPI003FCC00A3
MPPRINIRLRFPLATNLHFTHRTMSTIPTTMKALLIHKQGGPEEIKLETIPVPTLGEGEVLVKVNYAGVNFIDTYLRGGLYPVALPFTLGQEAAGTLVAVHESVKDSKLSVGDKVVAYVGGSYAEYVKVPAGKVFAIPSGVKTSEAAGVLTQGLTALTMLRESHAVKKGDWIVVHAAAGGVGLNLCQIASHFGAHVIGTTSTLEKAELARQNGAEIVVVGGKEGELQAAVNKATDGQGVIAIFDGVGKATFDVNWEILARKGTFVTFGNASGPPPEFSPLKLVKGNWKITRPTLNNFIFTPEEFHTYAAELFQLMHDKHVRLLISHVAPFTAEGLVEAHALLTGRQTVGKLVVEVSKDE